ncbi:MAG TPA: type II secretion system protein GspG [Blastocatellia bacterium]|nr:type II secretion system protein GspG [Blastocatellia bacterium]
MKKAARALAVIATAVLLVCVVAYARELGAREAREKIAQALGLDRADRVRIKSIAPGMGGEAIVEATVDTAVRFTQDKQGNWRAVELRAGDRHWESIELIQTALRKEKALRTTADLRTIATALEAFRRERGFYVIADTASALIDNLSPRYLNAVIRLDAWSHEFDYKGTAAGYRLTSLGPDGKPSTGDEIVIENGQLVKEPGE